MCVWKSNFIDVLRAFDVCMWRMLFMLFAIFCLDFYEFFCVSSTMCCLFFFIAFVYLFQDCKNAILQLGNAISFQSCAYESYMSEWCTFTPTVNTPHLLSIYTKNLNPILECSFGIPAQSASHSQNINNCEIKYEMNGSWLRFCATMARLSEAIQYMSVHWLNYTLAPSIQNTHKQIVFIMGKQNFGCYK